MKMGIVYYISGDDFKAGSDSKTFNASRQSFESFALDQERDGFRVHMMIRFLL